MSNDKLEATFGPTKEPTKEISKWADEAMFEAEPMPFDVNEGSRIYFLQGTPDPLGSIAAFSAMYTGKVVRDKRDVTDEERRYHLEQMKKTKLKAPLESVQLHFMVEGVTRSFTHQMVRQRTAAYAQESLRFAVLNDIMEAVSRPPSLAGTTAPDDNDMDVYMMDPKGFGLHERNQQQRWRTAWDHVIEAIEEGYRFLVDDGMPQEDARGLLPHAITTRLNYSTNLRNLQDHAGNRLCTQAQFEWRQVWVRIVEQMSEYCTNPNHGGEPPFRHEQCDNWQWKEIAGLFRPVCYLTGKCEFGAEYDRKCSIRSRVQANHSIGRGSEEWHMTHDPEGSGFKPFSREDLNYVDESWPVTEKDGNVVFIGNISPSEWLTDPGAAR